MPRISIFLLLLLLSIFSTADSQTNNNSVSLGKVVASFALDEKGTPSYSVSFDNQPVINSSRMGFALKNMAALDAGFEIIKTDTSSFDETWQPVWGEVKNIRNHYKQLTVHLQQKSSSILLNIVFRVFEDGVGFRYEFPVQPHL